MLFQGYILGVALCSARAPSERLASSQSLVPNRQDLEAPGSIRHSISAIVDLLEGNPMMNIRYEHPVPFEDPTKLSIDQPTDYDTGVKPAVLLPQGILLADYDRLRIKAASPVVSDEGLSVEDSTNIAKSLAGILMEATLPLSAQDINGVENDFVKVHLIFQASLNVIYSMGGLAVDPQIDDQDIREYYVHSVEAAFEAAIRNRSQILVYNAGKGMEYVGKRQAQLVLETNVDSLCIEINRLRAEGKQLIVVVQDTPGGLPPRLRTKLEDRGAIILRGDRRRFSVLAAKQGFVVSEVVDAWAVQMLGLMKLGIEHNYDINSRPILVYECGANPTLIPSVRQFVPELTATEKTTQFDEGEYATLSRTDESLTEEMQPETPTNASEESGKQDGNGLEGRAKEGNTESIEEEVADEQEAPDNSLNRGDIDGRNSDVSDNVAINADADEGKAADASDAIEVESGDSEAVEVEAAGDTDAIEVGSGDSEAGEVESGESEAVAVEDTGDSEAVAVEDTGDSEAVAVEDTGDSEAVAVEDTGDSEAVAVEDTGDSDGVTGEAAGDSDAIEVESSNSETDDVETAGDSETDNVETESGTK